MKNTKRIKDLKESSSQELKDTSPQVFQRDKTKEIFEVRDLAWTPKQLEFIHLALNRETRILLVNGPAGSAKTLLSVYCSLKLLNEKRISDILYLRSAVESADKTLGYLPGSEPEKMFYFNLPFFDKLEELLNTIDLQRLQKEKRINTYAINFCRGLSWNAKAIIIDEAQNLSQREIITALTRLGKFTRCFILADTSQTDLNNGRRGGMERIFNLLSNEDSKKFGIHTFTFTEDDILRSELVKFLVKKFKELPST